tara:strand:- start:329 stop:550 length:222 start_codon:yes stop_codon:yes gene_type:complete
MDTDTLKKQYCYRFFTGSNLEKLYFIDAPEKLLSEYRQKVKGQCCSRAEAIKNEYKDIINSALDEELHNRVDE